MIKDIGTVLSKFRNEIGISQKELAKRLRELDVEVTNQAVSKWENGATQPNATQFIALCQIMHIEDIIGEFTDAKQGGLLEGLNTFGKARAAEYIELLKLSGKYLESEGTIIDLRKIPLYNIPASAGSGQFLDSDDYETVEVGKDVPASANFGVRIAGDSMEPKYHDGDIVWVMQNKNLNGGDIGIFLWDGNVYCKKLDKTDGVLRLISLNSRYAPMEITGETDFRVFGKVVGKWNTE